MIAFASLSLVKKLLFASMMMPLVDFEVSFFSSSVVTESTDMVCASSAAPAAGIAKSPPKVMVVSALDPHVICFVRHKVVDRQSLAYNLAPLR